MALSDYFERVDKAIKRDDIRGVYGESIDADFANNLGLALAETLAECTAVEPVNVVVGHDMRLSGPVLAEALCTGLDDGGCRSIMMGRAGTELVGFLPAKYSDVIDGGVMITASHNPKDNNGFKFFGRGGMPPRPKNLNPLLSLGLCEAVIITPPSMTSEYLAGRNPTSSVPARPIMMERQPPSSRPVQSASASTGPLSRMSWPTTTLTGSTAVHSASVSASASPRLLAKSASMLSP